MNILKVEPHAQVSYAAQIDRAGDDSQAVSDYITKNAMDGTGGELIGIANDGNRSAVAAVEATFNGLTCLLENSAIELRAAAEYYRETNLAAAIDLDRALPASGEWCPTVIENEVDVCPPLPFQDSRLPVRHLMTPDLEPESPINKMGWMDYVSPTSWTMKGFDIVFGFDPIQEVQNKLFGDWEVLARMQPVLANSATAVHDLAYNVQAGANALQDYWQGNAGDAAHRCFTDFATSVDQLRSLLATMATEYRTMAEAVWEAGDAVGGLIKGICDAALIAGLAAAGGTATAMTGAGAAVGWGLAAAEAANMLAMWGTVTKYLAYADSAVKGFRSAVHSRLSELEAIAPPSLGGAAGYDHPLTGAGAHV